MGREDKIQWKSRYFTKLVHLLDEYPKYSILSRYAYIAMNNVG